MTRALTRGDLLSVLDVGACVEALREGFRHDDRLASPGSRIRGDLLFPGTATVLIPGLLPGVEAYTVKVNAEFPGARPALRGVICLHGRADGALLALPDPATVTAWRTGLAAALGTHVVTTERGTGGSVVGVVGAGAQAELMVNGLCHFRDDLQTLPVHDSVTDRAADFAARHGGRTVGSAPEVAEASDTVLLATWSRRPLWGPAETRPGQHFTTLGVDEPGKQELAADLLAASFLLVDDHSLQPRRAFWPGATEARGSPRTPRSVSSCGAGAPVGRRDRGPRCMPRSVFHGRAWPSPGSLTVRAS
ncbi:ornithine cyclodeaminase family protein [Streptomyces sp. MA15]|uniref:ornithine cyclodeaminase family protein n=1 Tax=Streptomyces sp. MA15 TaxID=3055061 RepID=UPI00339D9D67